MGKGNNNIKESLKGNKSNNDSSSGREGTIGIKPPSFLTVTNSPVTSGTIELEYSHVPLPITSGGTGVTSVGSKGQVLCVMSTEPEQLGWVTSEGTGTVTSVSMTVPEFLNVTPSTITTSGEFSISLSSKSLPISSGGTGLVSLGQPSQVLSVNALGTELEYSTPQCVTAVSLSTTTPFLAVTTESITKQGSLAIDCGTIPVSHGGTGLVSLGQPSQILSVNSSGTELEYTTPQYVTQVSLSTTTPFLTVSSDPITNQGSLLINCGTVPVSHGGTGLVSIGKPSQILSVNAAGTELEYTTPQCVTSVSLSTATPFLSVSSDSITSQGSLAIECGTIPISHGGTGITKPGLSGQILTSDGSALQWTDPPNLSGYLTSIEGVSPLTYYDGKIAITNYTGYGKVVYDNSPILQTPILGDATCSSLSINGQQSGSVRLTFKSGSYNLILPNSMGQPSQVLISQGPFNPLEWKSTIGSGDIVCSQNPILTGQTIFTNGSVVCKSSFIQSKEIVIITENTFLSAQQLTCLLVIQSDNPITITIPLCQDLHNLIGDFTIGNRFSTLIYNKCPELTILSTEGIILVDGRSSSSIPVQECTYVMTNATEGLLLIK